MMFDNRNVPAAPHESFDIERLTTIQREEPHGVSGARNDVMQTASGNVLLMIDDDAGFNGDDCLEQIKTRFRETDRLGTLALDIHDEGEDALDRLLPFLKFDSKKEGTGEEQFTKVSYFIGTAYAISAEVVTTTEGYDDSMVYAFEEPERSRLMNLGSTGSGQSSAF